jgi:hypothetical protein
MKKLFTLLFVFLAALSASAQDLQGKLVIGKVFYAGSTRLNGATPKNYMCHLYIELYNNSAETIDVAGTYVAMANSDAAANAWAATDMVDDKAGMAVFKQVFQIPAGSPVLMEPGKSLVITNCAIDHSDIAEGRVDLSNADFEVKSANNAFNFHSETVPAMTLVYSAAANQDFINFMNPGPDGIALFKADTDIANCAKTYKKGKDSGNQYLIIPMANSIDAVDIVYQKTPSANDKRFTDDYDAGFTCTAAPNAFNCQAVARKVVSNDGSRKVLQDTNNSSDDFESLWNVQPRVYDVKEAASMAEFNAIEDGKLVKLALADARVNAFYDLDGAYYVEDASGATVVKGVNLTKGTKLNGYIVGTKSTTDVDYVNDPSQGLEYTLTVQNASWSAYEATETELVGTPMTIAEAAVQANYGRLVTLSDVEITQIGNGMNKQLKDVAGNTMKARDLFGVLPYDYEWPAKATSITGVVLYYMTGWFLIPISAEAIVTNATGIETIHHSQFTVKNSIYNLQGIRLNGLQRGLNIVNGKKVVIK